MNEVSVLQSIADEELAAQTRGGSSAAFEELLCRYERRVYAFVAHSCRNGTDAGEITQDTFVKAYQAIGQFDGRHAFAAWLFTIARHKCIDHYRAQPPAASGPMPDLADTDDPASLLVVREDRQDLWRLARRVLPELQFQAVWFKYAEDMDVAQVARVLGKTKTHVKVLLFRARQKLAQEFEKPEPGTKKIQSADDVSHARTRSAERRQDNFKPTEEQEREKPGVLRPGVGASTHHSASVLL